MFDPNEPIGSRALNEKLSAEMYNICKRIEEQQGLNNGVDALF